MVDEPDEGALQADGGEDGEENKEEHRLVVEDGDGLLGGADFGKPVELAHFGGGGGCVDIKEEMSVW